MFFKTKRNPRKTTRQTLSTEQLEPKAMFSVSPVEPVVALDVGPVNQAGYDCQGAGTCSADGFMKIGDIKGEVKPTERVGNDGRSIVHPQYNVGEDGRMIVHPQYNVGEETFTTGAGGDSICSNVQQNHIGGIAGPDLSTSLRSDNRFVFEIPKDDSGISLHASVNPHAGPEGFMKLGDIKGEFRQTLSLGGTSGPGGTTFMTGEDGVSIIHPSYHDGEDGVSIIHPSYHDGEGCRGIIDPEDNIGSTAGPGGSTYLRSDNRFVFETPKDDSGISLHASANPHAGPEGFMKLGDIKGEFRQTLSIGGSADSGGSTFMTGEDGRMIVHPQFNVGDDGRMIIHPQFNVGKATFTTGAGGDSIVHPQFNGGEDGRSIVHPQFCTVQPQVENVSLYDHVQTPRSQAFARMGR